MEKSKRIISALLVAIILLGIMPPPKAHAAEIGQWGDNVTWSFSDGTLTFSGEGETWNLPHDDYRDPDDLMPWGHLAERVTRLVIEPGITKINVPISYMQVNLEMVSIADSVEKLPHVMFYQCTSLRSVSLPESLQTIPSNLFYACSNLERIYIPANVANIGTNTSFGGLTSLSDIYFGGTEEQWINIDGHDSETYANALVHFNSTGMDAIEPEGDYHFVVTPAESLSVKAGEILKINCYLYNGDELVTNWNHPDVSISNPLHQGELEYLGWEVCEDGFTLSLKGVTAGTATIMLYHSSTGATFQANVEVLPTSIRLKAYTQFPDTTVGTDQYFTILFALFVDDGEQKAIDDYSIHISNPSVLEVVEEVEDGLSRIVVFRGISPGTADITFTDNSANATITLSLTVEYKCEYYRCTQAFYPSVLNGGKYIKNFSCSENGGHSVSFDVYNPSYLYGIVEVYNEHGDLIKVVPLAPHTDGNGLEKVNNSFKVVWDDITTLFRDNPQEFYEKDFHAAHTHVDLPNLPENAEIIITSNGDISDFVAVYTGVDVFVNLVSAATSLDLNVSAQKGTVKELVKAVLDALQKSASYDELEKVISQEIIKETAKKLANAFALESTADAASETYSIISNIFEDLNIDAEAIMKNVLKSFGYNIVDTAFTTAIPLYKIVILVDKVTEIAWPLVDYKLYKQSGKLEFHTTAHGISNTLANNSVTIIQSNHFSENTVADVYAVEEQRELDRLTAQTANELTNCTFYNISIRENGMIVQPAEPITLRIPVPQNADASRCAVYRVEDDGTLTRMPASYDDGYMVFETSHLSYYAIGELLTPDVSAVSIIGTYTTDLVMSAADLGVSAPDSVLRATLTFGEDGSASCTWEAVDLTAFRIFFHDMFVNAYYAMAYGAGITDLAEIERFCMESTGLSVSDYMDTLVTDQAMIESFTPASTSGTYSYNADHSAIFTGLAIMDVPSDPTIENSFVLGGGTLYLTAASWGKPDYTFVCTSR